MQADVKGSTLPLLEVLLDAGESIVSTHGELSWMTPNVAMSQTTTGGGQGGIMGSLKRAAGGGGIFLTRFEAQGGQGMVSFGAKLPGTIFPIDIAPGAGYLVHKHGWVCGTDGITPTMGLQQTFKGGLWGGDGFILQRLEGQGRAWIELSGEITSYQLEANQSMLVHPGHVGLFEDRVSFVVNRIQGIKNAVFGADGFHLVQLTGPGNIWLQSMPLPVLAHSLAEYLGDGDHHPAEAAGVGGILGGMIGKNL